MPRTDTPCFTPMRAALLCFAAFAAIASGRTLWYDLSTNYTFDNYLAEFSKSYSGAEYSTRKALFESNLQRIMAHNQDTTKTWKVSFLYSTCFHFIFSSALCGLVASLSQSRVWRLFLSWFLAHWLFLPAFESLANTAAFLFIQRYLCAMVRVYLL